MTLRYKNAPVNPMSFYYIWLSEWEKPNEKKNYTRKHFSLTVLKIPLLLIVNYCFRMIASDSGLKIFVFDIVFRVSESNFLFQGGRKL